MIFVMIEIVEMLLMLMMTVIITVTDIMIKIMQLSAIITIVRSLYLKDSAM